MNLLGSATPDTTQKRRVTNPAVLYLTAAVVILNSGAVYFQQVYLQEMTFVLLGISLLFFARNYMPASVGLTLLGFLTLSLLNYLVFPVDYNSYVALLMRAVAAALIAVSVDLRRFAHACLNVVLVIAITSIPFYLLGLLTPAVVREAVPVTAIYSDSFFRLTPLYVYGPYVFERNTSVFWEPGAYQAFLNVGLALALLVPGIRHRTPKVLLLLVVLGSTFSTTGYIIAPIWFACLAVTRRRAGAVLSGLFGAMVTILVIVNSTTVFGKFDASNLSYSRRMLDTTTTFHLMVQRPWTGWGFQNIQILEATYGGRNTSNSLLGVGYQWGVIPMLIMLVLNAYALRKLGLTAAQTAFAMGAYVIMVCSEDFIFSPMFLVVLFAGIVRGSENSPSRKFQLRNQGAGPPGPDAKLGGRRNGQPNGPYLGLRTTRDRRSQIALRARA